MEAIAEHGTLDVSVARSRGRRVARLLGALWCTALLWFCLVTLAPMAAGWRPMVVTSGSMSPAFRVGSVVLVAPSDAQHVRLRDIVVYEEGDRLITHRVVGIRSDGTIQTQGDANDRPDSDPVLLSQVRGEVRFVVPVIGLPIRWLHEGRIVPLSVLVLLTMLALAELPGPVPRRYRGAHFAPDDRADARARLLSKARMAGAITVVGAIVAGLSVAPVEAAFTSATTNDGNTFSAAASFGIRYRGLVGTASCGSPTLTVTVATAVSAGRTVIVEIGIREQSTAPALAVTDTRGNTYTNDAELTASRIRTAVFSAYVATALQVGDTISVTVPAGKVQSVIVSQFSGIAPSNRVDTSATAQNTNNAPTASVTTTWTDTLLFGAVTNRNETAYTEAANYLAVSHQQLNCAAQLADNHAAYRVVSATGTYGYASTLGGNNDWVDVLVAYKAADNVAPSAPVLSGTAGDQETNLSWTTVTDISSPVTYQLYRDGVQVYSGTNTSYNDTTVANGTTYAYTVKASDSYGNQSSASNEVDLTPAVDASIRYRRLVGTASCGGASSSIAVPADGIVAGRVLVIRVVLANTFAAGAISATDSKGNTYTLDKDSQSSSKARVAYLSTYVTTPLVNGDTITVTHPNSGAEYVAVNEISGVAQTGRVGVTSSATGSSTGPTANVTTVTSKTIVFAGIATGANSTYSNFTAGWTQGAGFTGPLCGVASSSNGAYQIVPSAATYTYGATLSGSTEWDEAMVAYKAADSVAPAAPTLTGANGDGEEFLSWNAVTDPSAPVTYQLYRDGVQIYTGTALKYDDLSRTNGTTYAYTLYATDSVGNTSVVSNTFNGKPVAGASPKYVQSVGTATCGSTSSTITVGAAGVPEGHTVVVRLSMHGATAGAVSATDSKGNTYSNDADAGAGDRAVLLSGYVNTSLVSGDTITVTHPTNTSSAVSAADFSGIAASSRVDATGTGTGSSTAPSASVTAVSTRTMLVNGTAIAASVTYTEATGWTQQSHQTSTCSSTAMGHTAYKRLYDAGANTYTATLSGSKAWSSVNVAYKSAGEDVTGPSAPTLSGSPFHAKASLSWTSVHDFSAPVTYHLKRDGVEIYAGSALSYDDTGRTNGVTYNYVVYATDSLGNVGTSSSTVPVTPVADTTAPAVPSGLTVIVGASGNIVSWGSVTDLNGPVTYQLYRGASLVYSGTNLTYTDAAGVVGSVYTVKASDSVPNQSAASSPVTATAGVVSSAVIGKQEAGTVGYLHQGGGYYIYANVSAGSQSVSANVSNVTTGATSVAMTAGSYTAGGVTYNYRSALQTANGTLAEGAKSFTVTPTGGSAYNGSVTIDNTAPTASDIQAVDGGGTVGKPEAGDVISYTFSEPPGPNSISSGWDGSGTVSVQVSFVDNGGSDSWTILSGDGLTTLPLGTVNCNDPVSANTKFNGTMSLSGNTVSITLGSMISGAVRTKLTNTAITWTPSASLRDRAANAMSTAVATESGTLDADF